MVFALVSLAGALVLFLLEPMLGKALTPRFGGGAQIWAVCLVFFQAMLFTGYVYAHVLQLCRSRKIQQIVHGALWGLAIVTMHSGFRALAIPSSGSEAEPVFSLLTLLFKTSALPMIALSSTSPLAQAWAASSGEASPYRLYAWSNIGSFAGLLAYPFILEPRLGISSQIPLLEALLVAVAALILLAAGKRRAQDETQIEQGEADPGGGGSSWSWLLASFIGAALLVALTTKMTAAIAAVPLLWIAPLGAYLLSFVLVFDARAKLTRGLWPVIWTVLFAVCLLISIRIPTDNGLMRWRHILSGVGMVFAGCMVCHGWLYEKRPPAARLTSFYLWISAGGLLGGLAAALLAPAIFDRLYEFGVFAAGVGVIGALAVMGHNGRARFFGIAGSISVVGLCVFAIRQQAELPGVIYRNFYGVVQVLRTGNMLILTNMKTIHGMVDLDNPRAPLAYYGPDSGAGRVLRLKMDRHPALSVGVLGLGLGSVADYCRPSDSYAFYEINPIITDLIGSKSSPVMSLKGAPGKMKVVEGDGRLAMEREARENDARPYDVLIVDAFSGDAVPWHLLTREAFQVYLGRLAPDGILLFHVSNPLPVDRLVIAQAREAGLYGVYLLDPGGAPKQIGLMGNEYIALCRDGKVLEDPLISEHLLVTFGPKTFSGKTTWSPAFSFMENDRAWTDNRSSLSDLVFEAPAWDKVGHWAMRTGHGVFAKPNPSIPH